MTETITQTYAEDAIARTDDFLMKQRGVHLDGAQAAAQVEMRVVSVQDRAEALLRAVPLARQPGFYAPLSHKNAHYFDEAAAVLPDHAVLVPSALVEPGGPAQLYPAIVSEESVTRGALRLHVLRQPYRGGLRYGTATVMSAAGQSETAGVGSHSGGRQAGTEAEHLPTLMAISSDPQLMADWKAGAHINHAWRTRPDSSVLSEVSRRLPGSDMPLTPITVTREDIVARRAMLLWHERMVAPDADGIERPERATRHNALLVAQALGFQALTEQNPHGLVALRSALA